MAINDITPRKLSEIYETGTKSIKDFDAGEPLVLMMRSTLGTIEIRLGYTNIRSSLRHLGTDTGIQIHNYFRIIEELFSKEITFLFYVALLRKVPYDYQSTNDKILPLTSHGEYSFASAMDMISNLVKYDQDIRSLVGKWVKNAATIDH